MKKFVEDFIDFGPGKPFYPASKHIEYFKPLKQQLAILREDMLQISYGDDSLNYIVDVGWYGRSFSLTGCFVVHLIKNYGWHKPIVRIKCKSVKRLVPALTLCVLRLKKDTADFYLLPNH